MVCNRYVWYVTDMYGMLQICMVYNRYVWYVTNIQFNSIHAFISDKSPYYTGYINYNHRLLIIN